MSAQRLILIAALAVFAAVIVLTGARIARHQVPPILATNGVGIGAVITGLPKDGDRVCLAPAPVPAGTAAVQLWLGWHLSTPVVLQGSLRLRNGLVIAVPPARIGPSAGFVALPLARNVDRESIGEFCVQRGPGKGTVDLAGANVIRLPDERGAAVNGRSLGQVEPAARFVAAGAWGSALGQFGPVLQRLGNLSPAPLGAAGVGVALLILAPAGLLLLMWNLATAPGRGLRRIAVFCALGSLAITVTWATVTPTFQGPDESEHFAYAQYLAETGRHPVARNGVPGTPGPYSTQQNAVLALLRNNAVVIDPAARQPWTATTRDEIDQTDDLRQDDGGGYTESASGHSVLYYALLAPALHLGGDSLELQVWFSRLISAALGALIAAFAALAAGILVSGRARLAALAGLAAATVPMAGAVAGTVNNDVLLNVAAAAGFAVVLALLVRPGGPLRNYAAAGAMIAVLPITKIAGLGMGLLLTFATLLTGLRRRPWPRILSAAGATAAGGVAVLGVLAAAALLVVDGQSLTLLNVHPAPYGSVPGVGGIPGQTRVDYIVQTLLPFLHTGGVDAFPGVTPYQDIYIRGLWGGFGWNRLVPPPLVFSGVQIAVAIGAVAGLVALWRERARWRDQWLAVLTIVLAPFVVIAFVAFAFTNLTPHTTFGEQGRYLLPALVPIALWLAVLPAAVPAGPRRSLVIGAEAGLLCGFVIVSLAVAAGGWASP